MKNRYCPFGYQMNNGTIEPETSESQTVARMYNSYLAGKSLKEIAIDLSAEKVSYLEGQTTWDKCRVSRILSDRRNCGEKGFPAIVSKEIFQKAQAVRESKKAEDVPMAPALTSAVAPILCGHCGCATKRVNDKRFRFQQKHVCLNPDCQAEYLINDDRFCHMILRLLSEATIVYDIRSCQSMATKRMENEIARRFDERDPDVDSLRTMILELAAEKYCVLTCGLEITDKLRTALAPARLSFSNIRRTVMETVKQITLIDDSSIEIVLINNQVVREEHHHGADSAAKDGSGNPADNSPGAGEGVA